MRELNCKLTNIWVIFVVLVFLTISHAKLAEGKRSKKLESCQSVINKIYLFKIRMGKIIGGYFIFLGKLRRMIIITSLRSVTRMGGDGKWLFHELVVKL